MSTRSPPTAPSSGKGRISKAGGRGEKPTQERSQEARGTASEQRDKRTGEKTDTSQHSPHRYPQRQLRQHPVFTWPPSWHPGTLRPLIGRCPAANRRALCCPAAGRHMLYCDRAGRAAAQRRAMRCNAEVMG